MPKESLKLVFERFWKKSMLLDIKFCNTVMTFWRIIFSICFSKIHEGRTILSNKKCVRINVILSNHLPHKLASDIIVRKNITISSLWYTINTFHPQLKYNKSPVLPLLDYLEKDSCVWVLSGTSVALVYGQSWLMFPRFCYQLVKTAFNKSLFFSSKDNSLAQSVLLAWIFEQKQTKAVPQVVTDRSHKFLSCANLTRWAVLGWFIFAKWPPSAGGKKVIN